MIRNLVRARVALALSFFVLAVSPVFSAARHPGIGSLSKNSREIFLTSMQWGDKSWDSQAMLCRQPSSYFNQLPVHYYVTVRDSAWYAVGLLLRDQPGDRDRAAQTLRAILKQQFHAPGKPWDGTFRRMPTEPDPGANAVMWRNYDPNWREFIGTTFAVILTEYPDRIPADLGRALRKSIDYAIAGEIKEKRLLPSYTNISLMYGYLWNFAAVNDNRPEWVAPAVQWQEETYKQFKEHDAFFEFNSPTYSGVDIFALALWRNYGFTPRMRSIGSEMEAALWNATADLYNANLRNISGPYDRAYGMDMQSYVSIMGLWLRTVLDADKAPLTKFDPPVDHLADLWLTPAIAILDTRIPAEAMKRFSSFQGEHQVYRPITGKRIATAWIGKDLIYGGEITGHTVAVGSTSQFHAVTAQWQATPDKIGWLMLTRSPLIDASADKKGIDISATGDVSFRISAPGLVAANVKSAEWTLPGLTVHVNTDSKGFTAEQHGKFVDLTYTGMTKMKLVFNKQKK
jgi:hypothetical protein